MKKTLSLMIIVTLFTTLAYAGKEDIGTKTMQFLKIGVGARGTAMGGAQAAISDDVNSMYWNPAGLAEIENKEASFMHCEWLEEIKYEQLGYAKKSKKGSVLGIMINYLGMDGIDKKDNTGTLTGESYKPNDLAVIVGYAKKLEKTNIGINFKYVKSTIEEESASGIALDLGSQFKLNGSKLVAALAVQNIGQKVKFIKEEESMPLNIKVGLGSTIELFKNDCVLALDVNSPSDEEVKVNIGAEYNYSLNEKLTISPRLGYRTDKSDLEEGSNAISTGFGLTMKKINIDYAWAPYGELGATHKIAIITKF